MKPSEIATEAATKLPPLTVVGVSFMGFNLQQWVYIVTLIWVGLQIGHFIWTKFIRPLKERFNEGKQELSE